MKDYYKAIKDFIETNYPKDSEKSQIKLAFTKRMEELNSVKNDQVKLMKLYNDYKNLGNAMSKPIDESSKMTKSKFKEYIKEIITSTLNEVETAITSRNQQQVKNKINKATGITSKQKDELENSAIPGEVIDIPEGNFTELEPNSKQYRKVANRELAFLAKQVRSLEKQLKSQGSDENKG
jgi:hypothetical protein